MSKVRCQLMSYWKVTDSVMRDNTDVLLLGLINDFKNRRIPDHFHHMLGEPAMKLPMSPKPSILFLRGTGAPGWHFCRPHRSFRVTRGLLQKTKKSSILGKTSSR